MATRSTISLIVALAVALAIFVNRPPIARSGASVLVASLVVLLIIRRFIRRPSALIELGVVALVAIAVGACVRDRYQYSRCLLQVVLVWVPLLVLAHARALVSHWRELILLVLSMGVSVLAANVLGPLVLRQWVLAHYNCDIDHRPIPGKGGANSDALFTSYESADFHAEDLSIVCLGDSFTASHKVPEPARWPTLLEHFLQAHLGSSARVRVANFGWVSSSPLLQVRQLRQIGWKYKPDWVVQAVDMSDFWDDLNAAELFRRRGLSGGEITIWDALHARLSMALGVQHFGRWLSKRLVWRRARAQSIPEDRYFPMRQPLDESRPLLTTTWRAILATRDEARRLGAGYMLVIVPRYQQFAPEEAPLDPGRYVMPIGGPYIYEPFRFFAEQATTADFPIRSLLEDFRRSSTRPVCFVDDGHWDVGGNKVAAEAIGRYLLAAITDRSEPTSSTSPPANRP